MPPITSNGVSLAEHCADLLGADDCLMTQEEAEAMAHGIPNCRLAVVPNANHYTVLLGGNPVVRRELRAFLDA